MVVVRVVLIFWFGLAAMVAAEARPVQGALPPLFPDAINAAQPPDSINFEDLSPELTIKLQVALDRAHFSPGEIDGRMGGNTIKALEAFNRENGYAPANIVTLEIWSRLEDLGRSAGDASQAEPLLAKAHRRGKEGHNEADRRDAAGALNRNAAVMQVAITAADVKGPFARRIPKTMESQSRLRRLSYTSAAEELGERYHSSPELLHALNAGVSFNRVGETIWVPNIHSHVPEAGIDMIVANKEFATVTAYDSEKKVIAAYPATIGSGDKPSPSGDTQVKRAVRNPWYTYDPRHLHFKGVKAKRVLRIAPGPNNPVGLVWIALAMGEGYGIHGTAEPHLVSKNFSHGCVRLTNWDALELASMVRPGITIKFTGDGQENAPSKRARRAGR